MTDLFKSICVNRLPSGLSITFLSFSCSKVNKNTLIDYFEYLIDYIVLELFPDVGKNTLVDYLDNLIDYFVDLIHYRRL